MNSVTLTDSRLPQRAITLTQTSRQGLPLASPETTRAETVNLEAELEAEMLAYEAVAARTRATLHAVDRAGIFARAMHELSLFLSGLAFVWIAARLWTGV